MRANTECGITGYSLRALLGCHAGLSIPGLADDICRGHTHIMGFSGEETVLGLGHDLVSIAEFAERLAMPGTRMSRLFSVREQRQSQERARVKGDDVESHLAVRWAGKEAVLKAWSEALRDEPAPYGLDDFPWGGIEILDDRRGRPGVHLGQEVQDRLDESLPIRSGLGRPASGGSVMGCGGSVGPNGEAPYGVGGLVWHISLSHDGGMASAVVLLCCR